jgi:hypothetical protein
VDKPADRCVVACVAHVHMLGLLSAWLVSHLKQLEGVDARHCWRLCYRMITETTATVTATIAAAARLLRLLPQAGDCEHHQGP